MSTYIQRIAVRLLLFALPTALLAGCQTINESIPRRPGFSQKQADKVGAALSTRPTGRDLDREGLQLTRTISSLSNYTTRLYEQGDGQFVVDEKHTMPDGKTVVEYLSGQDPRHLRYGVVYFISQGSIANQAGFVAIKTFCIDHDVDLYIADSMNVRNIWTQGRLAQWDSAGAGEVAWIIQARP